MSQNPFRNPRTQKSRIGFSVVCFTLVEVGISALSINRLVRGDASGGTQTVLMFEAGLQAGGEKDKADEENDAIDSGEQSFSARFDFCGTLLLLLSGRT